MVYDPDSLDLCTRTGCDDPATGGEASTTASSTGPATSSHVTAGTGGRSSTAGAGGARADSGTDESRPSGGGAAGAAGSGSGGASGAGSGNDAAPEASQPDVAHDATATTDAGPDPTARCPSSLSLTDVRSTAQHGMPQNGPTSTDLCPAGQVLVGYALSSTTPSNFTTALVSKIEPSCGTVSIASDRVGCRIVVSTGANLPARGRFSNGATVQRCPQNQIVVAFKGRSGRDVDQLGFGCAPLEITKVNSSFLVTTGTVTQLGTVGGTGGSAFQDGCPADQVAIGNKITDENGFIGAFGLVCASMTLAP
jgi:hypothetical protein